MPHAIVYATNVAAFLHFRTGQWPASRKNEEILAIVQKLGYFTMAAGNILVLLIDDAAAALTTKQAITGMMGRIEPQLKGVREFIIVTIIKSSHAKINALKSLRAAVEGIAGANASGVHVRFENGGIFAFNALKRPAFAPRASLAKHLEMGPLLTSEVLTAEERRPYETFLPVGDDAKGQPRGWTMISPLEEGDALCLWNGYRVGEIIKVESLSPNAIGAIQLRRVVPATLPKDEPEKKAEGGEGDE